MIGHLWLKCERLEKETFPEYLYQGKGGSTETEVVVRENDKRQQSTQSQSRWQLELQKKCHYVCVL